jgi:hypothetical protein
MVTGAAVRAANGNAHMMTVASERSAAAPAPALVTAPRAFGGAAPSDRRVAYAVAGGIAFVVLLAIGIVIAVVLLSSHPDTVDAAGHDSVRERAADEPSPPAAPSPTNAKRNDRKGDEKRGDDKRKGEGSKDADKKKGRGRD